RIISTFVECAGIPKTKEQGFKDSAKWCPIIRGQKSRCTASSQAYKTIGYERAHTHNLLISCAPRMALSDANAIVEMTFAFTFCQARVHHFERDHAEF